MSIAHCFMVVSFCTPVTRRARAGNCGTWRFYTYFSIALSRLPCPWYVWNHMFFLLCQCLVRSFSNGVLDRGGRRSSIHRKNTGTRFVTRLKPRATRSTYSKINALWWFCRHLTWFQRRYMRDLPYFLVATMMLKRSKLCMLLLLRRNEYY